VHLTETCDGDTPHLITNVETTAAAIPDDSMLAVVHASLAAAGRPPSEHLVDKGYADSHVLVDSQRWYGITITGPVADDPSWQYQTGTGFAKADFVIDWEQRTATCPAGKQSFSWLTNPDVTKPETTVVRFSRRDCSLALPAPSARGAMSSRANWCCNRVSSTKPCRADTSRPRPSRFSTQPAPESRAHTSRRSAAQACGARAASAWTRLAISTSPLPRR
jgi:hypothetical protein